METSQPTISNEELIAAYLRHSQTEASAQSVIKAAMAKQPRNIAEIVCRRHAEDGDLSCFDSCDMAVSPEDRELLLLLALGNEQVLVEAAQQAALLKAKQALVRQSNNLLVAHYRQESSAPQRIRSLVFPAIMAQTPEVDVVAELRAGRAIEDIIGTNVGRADADLFEAISDGTTSLAPKVAPLVKTRKRPSLPKRSPRYSDLSRALLPKGRSGSMSAAEARRVRRLRDKEADERWRAPNGLCQAGRNPGAGHGKWRGHRSPATFVTG